MPPRHPLHRLVGDLLLAQHLGGAQLRLSPECGGKHHLPLFYEPIKSAATEFTDVDALLMLRGRVQVILEIEELVTHPGHLLGKYLGAALCHSYIYDPGRERAELGDDLAFVQILNATGLPEGSSKPEQWRNLEQAISRLVPILGTRVASYVTFVGTEEEFRGAVGRTLLAHVRSLVRA